jgi:hypothetical protein
MNAPSDGVRISKDLSQLVAMSRQQLRVSVLYVALALLSQFDLPLEPRARETAGHDAARRAVMWPCA